MLDNGLGAETRRFSSRSWNFSPSAATFCWPSSVVKQLWQFLSWKERKGAKWATHTWHLFHEWMKVRKALLLYCTFFSFFQVSTPAETATSWRNLPHLRLRGEHTHFSFLVETCYLRHPRAPSPPPTLLLIYQPRLKWRNWELPKFCKKKEKMELKRFFFTKKLSFCINLPISNNSHSLNIFPVFFSSFFFFFPSFFRRFFI